MDLTGIRAGFAITGSFCTLSLILPQVKKLKEAGADILPIISESAACTDTRFGTAQHYISALEEISGKQIIKTIKEAEPIGPKKLLDILIIAPCTGNTLSKLAAGITDTCVAMAAKAHIRNNRPILIAISTNDALGTNAKNLGLLLNSKNVFFVPFRQEVPMWDSRN